MALPDAVKGGKRPSALITWLDGDDAAVDLSGATITARITDDDRVTRDADGDFVITDAANGVFRWDYGDTDIGTAGTFNVQFSASFGTSPTPLRMIMTRWIVHPYL